MKIVKRGSTMEKTIFIGTCSKCKSVIEAEGRELIRCKSGDYRTNGKAYGDGYCPVCQEILTFSEK